MTTLAIQKAGGLCPAGNLGKTLLSLENGPNLDRAALAGECDPAALKELGDLLPGLPLRRLPRLAKIALRAALDAADFSPGPVALLISTVYGSVASTFEFLDSILRDGAGLASPTAFSHSVTNMTAALVSQGLGLTGPCLTITQPSLRPALEAAAALLASGQADSVLWGTVSERSGVLAEVEKLAGRNQFSLTDGAVFFQLSRPDLNQKEILISLDAARAVSRRNFEDDGHLAEAVGPGPLALALRLALTSLILEKTSTRPTSRVITDGWESLVISNGGESA